jgi:hypothetical protein
LIVHTFFDGYEFCHQHVYVVHIVDVNDLLRQDRVFEWDFRLFSIDRREFVDCLYERC